MFSLKTRKLKYSIIGFLIWMGAFLVYAALLQLYWMPIYIRASLLLVILVAFIMFSLSSKQVGINGQGAFLTVHGRLKKLTFLRANGIQLIARATGNQFFWDRLCPSYVVIYRDNLSNEEYSILRSFATQQILLSREKE